MAFTRFNYDDARVKKNLQQATGPGRYILDKPGWGAKPGIFNDPQMRINTWGANLTKDFDHLIDVETLLWNKDTKLSKYNCNYKFVKQMNKSSTGHQFPVYNKPVTDESRATHPAFQYRDLQQHQPTPLFFNPQQNIDLRFPNNVNTRLIERDNHKPIIPQLD
tara:strand:- start:1830 stop:2318 length:489 start_codon:yes stop_codon:yes gene_type:complete